MAVLFADCQEHWIPDLKRERNKMIHRQVADHREEVQTSAGTIPTSSSEEKDLKPS